MSAAAEDSKGEAICFLKCKTYINKTDKNAKIKFQ